MSDELTWRNASRIASGLAPLTVQQWAAHDASRHGGNHHGDGAGDRRNGHRPPPDPDPGYDPYADNLPQQDGGERGRWEHTSRGAVWTGDRGSAGSQGPQGGQQRSRMIPGGTFILDAPDRVPAVWGSGDQVLWAQGEPLIIAGPNGIGKTSVAGELIAGRIGDPTVRDQPTVFGHPVRPGRRRVMYLAMDRPQQIARSLRRTLGHIPRDHLDARLRVWAGPPPADLAAQPDALRQVCMDADADTLIVDSLKDAFLGLSDDERAAGWNRARQNVVAAGIEICELHHPTKRGPNGAKPKTITDVYGSAWLTAGAGSVLMLWGDPGASIVDVLHLKPPADLLDPFQVIRDHQTGRSAPAEASRTVVDVVAASPYPMTAVQVAVALFGCPDHEDQQRSNREKARRRLLSATKDGLLAVIPGTAPGMADVWTRPR